MLNVNKLKVASVLGVIIMLGGGCVSSRSGLTGVNTEKLETPSGEKIHVEVARTIKEQSIGLSGREDVGGGMLFCFDNADRHEFWMLGMMTSIDMIWIHNGKVVRISDNVPIQENGLPTRRNGGVDVDAVLEVGAGMAEELQIIKGSELADAVRLCE